jgi:hypothetical protein
MILAGKVVCGTVVGMGTIAVVMAGIVSRGVGDVASGTVVNGIAVKITVLVTGDVDKGAVYIVDSVVLGIAPEQAVNVRRIEVNREIMRNRRLVNFTGKL